MSFCQGKKVSSKTVVAAPVATAPNPLFPARPKNWRIGGDLRVIFT